jgi:hypothetical protein
LIKGAEFIVSNLDAIKHITVYLTSYPWKQSRILFYECSY